MMKRALIFVAFAAFFLTQACNKVGMFDESGATYPLDAAQIAIAVSGPESDSKAVKTAWVSGDKINVWFDNHYSQDTPDLVLEYEDGKWVKSSVRDGAAVKAEGVLCALYESSNNLGSMFQKTTETSTAYQGAAGIGALKTFRSTPLLIAANACGYEYDPSTTKLSSKIDKWRYLTRLKVVITGLAAPSKPNYYGLKLFKILDTANVASRPFDSFGLSRNDTTGNAIVDAAIGSTAYALGVQESDGVAFYFESLSAAVGETVHFGLRIYDEPDKIRTLTVPLDKAISDSDLQCDGVKMAYSSFGAPIDNSLSAELLSEGGEVETDVKQTVDLSGREWSPYVQDLDFSYAGYKYGECSPPDVRCLGWKTYNVCDYGAIPNDGKSDRDAFIACLSDAMKVNWQWNKNNGILFNENRTANVIIYFPEGEFLLHSEEDNNEDGSSNTLTIRSGNWVLKGAGRGKTILRTTAPGYPGEPTASEKYWSGIPLMTITCWDHPSDFTTPVVIQENVTRGSFGVKVNSTAGLVAGNWVMISATVSDKDYIEQCLQPYGSTDLKTADIYTQGVKYSEYHKIKSISGNTVTFVEPIMFNIDAQYEFKLLNFHHYENVGIEDLTFKSCCPENYLHNSSYLYDSGYVMIWTRRLVNSWIRRVDFESVTEGITYEYGANCSAYDLTCSGTRGHNLARSANSTRIFIGATGDYSDGVVNDEHNPVYSSRSYLKRAGQFHGTGVNALSIGTVLWRNHWGLDANFEMHAQQPRVSLFDCCKGGWMIYRGGGMLTSQPNHLEDLILWNMESETANSGFTWWKTGTAAYKVIPPVIVGFHGASCSFKSSEVRLDYSHGTAVNDPESLYEAQLIRRIGYLPAWVNELKTLNY